MMEALLYRLHAIVWSPVLIALILLVGVFFTLYLRFVQFRLLKQSIRMLFQKAPDQKLGSLSPLQALMTALAGIVGVGNIAGVATALTIGGVGAVFWMWVSGIFGMAISFAENTLSVCYREKTELGTIQGGPMLYLQKGVKSRFLAGFFALFCLASAFGLGNLVQAHTLSEAMYELFQVPHHITGILLAVAIGIVLVGGVKRVGKVATICVPVMGALYCASGLSIILFYWKGIPQAFWYILHAAFSPEAAIGGLVGAFFSTVRVGMARGIFSNEAGLGSAPIASAEAQVPSPAYQGVISMSGTFLSTCIVCTVTAFVIVLTGAIGENPGLTGATLTIVAFQKKLMFGGVVVGLSLFLFGYSTSLGWAYYGERALSFLLGAKAIIPFRFIFCGLLVVGSISSLETVWLYADIANGLMAYPNLIALLFLAREVKRELTHYLA